MCEQNRYETCYFWDRAAVRRVYRDYYGRCHLIGQKYHGRSMAASSIGCGHWQHDDQLGTARDSSPSLSHFEEAASRRPLSMQGPKWGVYNTDLGWLLRPNGSTLITANYGDALEELARFQAGTAGTEDWKVKIYMGVHETCPHCGHAQ